LEPTRSANRLSDLNLVNAFDAVFADAKTGTMTFNPGQTTKTITIEVNGDNSREANETFYLDLFGLSSNALFTKNRGLGTILNDEGGVL
jgi:hypothetical protein